MFSNTTDLDLRLIRVFLAVVDARGITAAEASLGIRQSTISTQLSVLETRLGFTLCERGRGGFRLTSKGERFAASARALMAATTDFVAQVREMDRKLVGTLAIGLIGQAPLTENARLAEAIGAFRARDQAVRFTMTVAPSQSLEEGIVNKQLDLAIGYFWHRVPGLVYTQLFLEQQEIYCGRGHPLFHSKKMVTVEDLLSFDWVWRSYHVPEEQLPLTQRHITATTDSIEAATILILSGGHLGYLPTHHAEALERRGLIRAVQRDSFSFDVPFHLVMKRGSLDKPVVKAFCENLLQAFGVKPAQP
ncbi:LysR family transcriptional regulator [Roseateles saccharophilus]|uniref:LysR family transcriptional regulator n=1 Tax=Roseateles saccharophilus TaxID=304 RepID=A0A4R3VL00_ROSSA|nr:LysR family transcriptional regulator [Roseateles saccharophilus]MDG0832916.1 LysR family transcriptional regulator [Roseateles saccharophilus]TCV04588.1 LysR family transcriptional regulator [Roseateles saccharophilus]